MVVVVVVVVCVWGGGGGPRIGLCGSNWAKSADWLSLQHITAAMTVACIPWQGCRENWCGSTMLLGQHRSHSAGADRGNRTVLLRLEVVRTSACNKSRLGPQKKRLRVDCKQAHGCMGSIGETCGRCADAYEC